MRLETKIILALTIILGAATAYFEFTSIVGGAA